MEPAFLLVPAVGLPGAGPTPSDPADPVTRLTQGRTDRELPESALVPTIRRLTAITDLPGDCLPFSRSRERLAWSRH